jgi:DNA-binding response OmpR family regulator
MKVLIVDDEAFIGDLFRDICEMAETPCDVALTREEARDLMEKETYDMVFVDYSLKGGDGIAFMDDMKSNGWEGSAVLISGWPPSHFRPEDLLSFKKVLHKPFNIKDVLDILKNHG